MRAKAQGIVQLEATVQVDGSVTDVHVIKTLHPDLDRNAVTVLRQWKFVPAIVNGSPIPTIERIDLTYTLR
jgi:TonB family protein